MAQDLSVHQAVGLMACLVWREKSDTGTRVSAELEGPVGALREAAKRVAKVGHAYFQQHSIPALVMRQSRAEHSHAALLPESWQIA